MVVGSSTGPGSLEIDVHGWSIRRVEINTAHVRVHGRKIGGVLVGAVVGVVTAVAVVVVVVHQVTEGLDVAEGFVAGRRAE